MKVIKKQSKNTYKNKEGKEVHYYNYYLITDNGKEIAIKCTYSEDYKRLDMVAVYVN